MRFRLDIDRDGQTIDSIHIMSSPEEAEDIADRIMSERGCPAENGDLRWLDHPHGEQRHNTIRGVDSGVVRCGHQH